MAALPINAACPMPTLPICNHLASQAPELQASPPATNREMKRDDHGPYAANHMGKCIRVWVYTYIYMHASKQKSLYNAPPKIIK